MNKIFPFGFYFLNFAGFALVLPFFVIFYQSLNFTGTQIGLLTGIPPLITLMIAPLGTGLADRTHRHKLIMTIGMIVAVIVGVSLPNVSSFAAVFALIIMYNIFMSPVGSLGDSATMTMLGDQRDMYGRIRMGGTIGWGIFALVGGVLVDHYGLPIAFYLFAVMLFLSILVVQKFSFGETSEHATNNGGIQSLLRNRRWILFLLHAFFGGIGLFTVAAFLYPYMAEMNASETTMGIASLIATFVELPVFFFANRLLKRFSSQRLLIASVFLIGVRSLLYAWVSTPTLVLFVQAFSGAIFPLMWTAGVAYAHEHAPAGLKSTAQGLFTAMSFGFGSAVGGFVGGLLLESVGGRQMFLIFGLVILIGLGLVETFNRILPDEIPLQA